MKHVKRMVLLYCLLPLFAYAQTQELIPLDSSLYAGMDALYLIQGIAPPSSARPWTVMEARAILGRIDGSRLGQAEQRLYDQMEAVIGEELRWGLDDFTRFDAALAINIEAYAHSNPGDYVLDTDWNYGFEERRYPILLSLEIALGAFFYGHADTNLGYGWRRYTEADAYRPVNEAVPGGVGAFGAAPAPSSQIPIWSAQYSAPFASNISPLSEVDQSFPRRAVFILGGEHWNVGLFRDRLQWGNGHSGNFIFDSHSDYTDFFRFTAFSGAFRYEWVNAFYTKVVPPNYWERGERTELFMAHRIEFRLFGVLTVAASENVMYYDEELNFANINPSLIWHNLNKNGILNSIAHVELDYAFMPGFNAYVQFALDQATALTESEVEDAAWGLLAGVEYARALGPGVLTASLEAAYTTPLLYRRFSVDFLRVQTYSTRAFTPAAFDYIGYPYGGDAVVLQFDAAWNLPSVTDLSLRLLGMVHGKMNPFVSHNSQGNNDDKPNLHTSTPSGNADEREWTFAATLRGSYAIPQPLRWLAVSAWAQLDIITKTNKLMYSATGTGDAFTYHKSGASLDVQFSLGVGVRL